MPRKQLQDIAPRTIRVHVPSYTNILRFFGSSPSGIKGSDAIRQVLFAFGNYCEEQMKLGRVASTADLSQAERIVAEIFANKENRPKS